MRFPALKVTVRSCQLIVTGIEDLGPSDQAPPALSPELGVPRRDG